MRDIYTNTIEDAAEFERNREDGMPSADEIYEDSLLDEYWSDLDYDDDPVCLCTFNYSDPRCPYGGCDIPF